ncbi:deoxyuridine 5'-triphosphate nucleotidohydrolase [Methanocella sp. CWC-04]|uniref:Deoxyuridine 5'-triphosphate nucleotidohydrolase n=1 Tax=Methanooceanicella nereidis TaxID=2052831 RepID=A0AAP2RCP5_9EURY|nr:deoxyuridine 5'-triphosphate nucleotidohydrolase [Methanocella sp. CWC-04]MCD1294849.1 deoxyuridine 5'-triphosphate nucleotidohydrolase [Methanocella sp. CWC-04]
MILGKTELSKLLSDKLVECSIDESSQLQVNGYELTVSRIEAFEGPGRIGFDNSERVLPSYRAIEWDDGWAFLKKGCYKITFNEIVSIPKDMCAIALPRSSLLRSGASIHTAVWDAGYKGRSEAMLVVYNDDGFYLKKDARVIQLLFMRLGSAQEGYSGRYMNENISG